MLAEQILDFFCSFLMNLSINAKILTTFSTLLRLDPPRTCKIYNIQLLHLEFSFDNYQ